MDKKLRKLIQIQTPLEYMFIYTCTFGFYVLLNSEMLPPKEDFMNLSGIIY